MPAGRPPKPTALKLLEGNPGHRKINKSEPKPTAEIPPCPAWLSDDAKREWNSKAGELHRIGLLTVIDDGTLLAWCEAVSDLKEANDALLKHKKKFKSYDVTTDKGNVISHPAVHRKSSATDRINKLSSKFGLSPGDRAKLQVGQADAEDELSEFLKSA